MKIIFAIKKMDNAAGGAERVLASVATRLAEKGHDITLLSFDQNDEGGKSFYPLASQIRQLRLGVGDAGKPTSGLEALRRIKILRETVPKEKPDVVIAFMHSMFIPVVFALAGTGIPVIASEHIVPKHYQSRHLEFLLLIASILTARCTTVLSSHVRALYPFFLRKRLVVMPNPVEIPVPTEGFRTQSEKIKTILNVGRLDPQKDQKILIDAFAILANRHPDWRLKIIGEGDCRPLLEAQIRQLGLETRIFLPGIVREIQFEYSAAHIFAMPSSYESFGLATAEALMLGLPAVGFADCPGTNELIRDQKNGILVKKRTPQALAAALETLMISKDLRIQYGNNGRHIMDEYNPGRVADLWETLIGNVADRSTLKPLK